MMPDRDTCLFCKIADKKIKAFVLYEDEHSVVFLDIQPRVEGHVVVVPKVHAAALVDMSEEEIGPLFSGVKHAAKIVSGALKVDGLTIGINQGSVSGQTINHLHVHVFPRFKGDGGGSMHSIVNVPSVHSVEEIYKKIKQN